MPPAFVIVVPFAVKVVIPVKANHTVLFSSVEDTIVTVHSNIPYVSVNTVSLTLNGISATFSKADACGDLVVKFGRADVKDIVEPGIATLTLSGELKDGSPFEASDTITVKE